MDYINIYAYIICVLFISVVSVDYFNLYSRLKRKYKVLECLPCFTFWTSVILFIPFNGLNYYLLYLPMLNFLIAVQWNKR